VSVMTPRSMLTTRIDLTAAEKQLAEESKKAAPTEEEQAIRDRNLLQARAQIRAARRAAR
jgi:hypothetical protein